jgi:hypothetical protein
MPNTNNKFYFMSLRYSKWPNHDENVCEQDCITQAAALVTPCTPDSPGRDPEGASAKEATKAAAVLNRPSIGEATNTPSDGGGSASPSI